MNKPTPKILTNNDEWQTLQTVARERLHLELSAVQLEQLERYLLSLEAFNEHTNLVSNANPGQVIRNHVLDSLTLVPLILSYEPNPESTGDTLALIDIGSGAGFPALILAIVFPQLHVSCIESIGKKTRFLDEITSEIQLESRVTIYNGRAEEVLGKEKLRDRFDFGTARAVGKLDLVAELTLPYLRVGGRLLAQKSRGPAESELPQCGKALSVLGGLVSGMHEVDRAIVDKDFVIVEIVKEKPTPLRFPRTSAQLKRPI